ncbi:tyrosine-protein phosphatase [Belnapia sp. F-4-1]|uniref:tyrosine-protein phosphatase n=1 Tax=Belnapia sp. F-4-1 TaxID=1545443 RepID=UPI00068B2895|nr:tyrosine-protein phosphatase [Belnapia sp. F-4-1]
MSRRDILATGRATGEDVLTLLGRAYTAHASEKLPIYHRLLALIADPMRQPLVFHCSAGKDCTGFGTALLLLALGVACNDIIEDYLDTNRIWCRKHAAGTRRGAPCDRGPISQSRLSPAGWTS